jgi:hypothetical protein
MCDYHRIPNAVHYVDTLIDSLVTSIDSIVFAVVDVDG